MPNKHYIEDCGCMYTQGDSKPWYICAMHFSQLPKPAVSAYTRRYWLYTLKLTEEKHYIGITGKDQAMDRIKQHGSFYGARWTYKYKPVEVVKIRSLGMVTKLQAERAEQELTMEYIKKFGLSNVRGGNLTYSGKYRKFGNRYFRDTEWESFIATLFLCIVIAILGFIAWYKR